MEGIRANKLAIARYIVKDYKPFDPAHPDSPEAFAAPASPGRSTQHPEVTE